MSSHVFLITAYSDYAQLHTLLSLLSSFYDCYVHIDKKAAFPKSFYSQWLNHARVRFISTQRIYWGSYRHVLAVMDLLNTSNKKRSYQFYHIISENTMPTCTKQQFEKFFELHKDNNFIEMTQSEVQDPTFSRTRYFYFQSLFNSRSWLGHHLENALVGIQRVLHIDRRLFPAFKGYLYCHLNDDFVSWLVQNNNIWFDYLKSIKNAFVCEEYFFQNLIIRSPFADTCINDSLIFDIWDKPERGQPAALIATDIPALENSSKLFARKFTSSQPNLSSLASKKFVES